MNRYKFILLCIILVFYAIISTSNINKPILHHGESNLAHYGILSRNLITYRANNTNYAPLNISGPMEYYDYKKFYKVDHPFLPTYIISLMYRVFCVSELAIRVPFVILAFSGIVIFYLLAKRILGCKAIISVAIFALNPMYAYMSQATVQQSGTLFFILLSLLFYLHYNEQKLTKYLIYAFISMFLACNMDWPGYWIAVVLFIYDFFVEKESKKVAFGFIIANFVFFGLYILHIYLLDTENLYPLKWLFFAGASRSLSELPGVFEYLFRESREIAIYFTLPVLALTLVWLIKFIKGPRTKSDWFILATIFLGLDEVVFPNLAYNHDYYSYYLVVFLSLSAGAGFYALYNLNKVAKLIAITLVCAFVAQSAIVLHNRYTKVGAYELYYKMALAINKHTDYKDKILILIDNLEYYTPFYADRYYMTYYANKEELLETNVSPRVHMTMDEFKKFILKNKSGFAYAIATTKKMARKNVGFLKDADDSTLKKFNIEDENGELYKFMSQHYPREIHDGFTFFKLM